jgi:hypothetical protein
MTICAICNMTKDNKFPLHLRKIHNLSYKEYFDQYLKTENDGICKECGKQTEWNERYGRYRLVCNRSCNTAYNNHQISIDPDRRETHREHMQKVWSNPEYATRMLQVLTDNGYNSNIVENIARLRQDPEYNLKFCIKQADNFKGKRYPYKNYILRSSWELEFAEFLDQNNIEYEYEKLLINYYKNNTYLTDFYLKNLNLVVEIHPIKLTDEWMVLKMKATKKAGYKFYFMNENNWNKIKTRVIKLSKSD